MNTNLKTAAVMVSELSRGNWDRTLLASDLEFLDFDTLKKKESGETYSMLPSAKRLIAQRLKTPADYIERCPRDLQERNLNYWLRRLGDAPLFCRFNGQNVRAFFTPCYKPIDNADIMARLTEVFPSETRVEFRLSNDIMILNIPDYQQVFSVNGERIAPGSNFSNSEVGLVSYSCSVFYQRLVCTNGLITVDTIAVRRRHVKRNALDDFNFTMEEVRRLAMYQSERVRISTESKVDDPLATIAAFGRRFQLGKDEIELVHNSWRKDPVPTMWGIIQAFTAAANNTEIPADLAYRFQRAGGQVLALVR